MHQLRFTHPSGRTSWVTLSSLSACGNALEAYTRHGYNCVLFVGPKGSAARELYPVARLAR